MPAAAAIATALDVTRADRAASPLAFIGRGVASGLVLAALGLGTALVHGLRVGFCDLPGGARGYVLTAGIGAVMGGAWGRSPGGRRGRRRRKTLVAVLLALAAPLGGIVISLARFYTSPMVFAFDPFFGYFSGTLYDTVIDAGTPLLTYRLASLCTLAGVALLASVLTWDAARAGASFETSIRARRSRERPARARFALGVLLAGASLVVAFDGAKLGHWETASTIAETLGGWRAGPRCDVVYPDGLREEQIGLLVKDCEEELAHDEAFLGAQFSTGGSPRSSSAMQVKRSA